MDWRDRQNELMDGMVMWVCWKSPTSIQNEKKRVIHLIRRDRDDDNNDKNDEEDSDNDNERD